MANVELNEINFDSMSDFELLEYERLVELDGAYENFYKCCQYLQPEFYNSDRPYLKEYCDTLQAFYECRIARLTDKSPWIIFPKKPPAIFKICYKLMVNMPPQTGKSRTLVLFTQWCLGRNQDEKVITGSFNDDSASEFSRFTRDGIAEEKNAPDQHVYSDVFPTVRLKRGNTSVQKWALEGQHFSYLGTGLNGTVTGKGATIRIVDDIIKGVEQAISARALEKAWLWYSGTFSSRRAAGEAHIKEIFNATPWAKKDPQGILKETEGNLWYIFSKEMYDDSTGKMLSDKVMPYQEYIEMKNRALRNPITAMVFWANYHHRLVDVEGRMYSAFKTYKELPMDVKGRVMFDNVRAYVDTADEGKDYLCMVIYGVYQSNAYILDVYYTQDGMETTEPETARRLLEFDVKVADVESNNGGRGFARKVKEIITKAKGFVAIKWFHQSKNKKTRINVNSATVQERVFYPIDWAVRWPEYYEAMTSYTGKNDAHDDGPDATTGVIEKMAKGKLKW
jgi:predicted phage terminase large subunit-like protein